ncbi:NUDIX hydrolase [Thermosipho atlanticus]|uniref:NUDIX domain-containing protein n=1 Tax=Thermosipho atlanticus DSM 15807 TaxID=1123380 RepID=A0A1M5SJ86_9BACT|nr:CoA pyrophosphatase [Thermosipho atlanticus]SHH38624.1 NUDIX domain-containing protein [Thermosipho atlanticus DSM 15807]
MKFFEEGFLSPTTEYSVIIPIINKEYFLFELRSKNLKIQPQEISFPGGKVETNESPLEAGIRELYEEIGIKPIEIIGKMKSLITPFNIVIHPFIATIDPTNMNLNPEEVEKVFYVPINFFEKPTFTCFAKLKVSPTSNFPYHLIPGGQKYVWREGKYKIMFFLYEELVIWGITARLAFEAYKKLKGGF